MQLPRDRKLWFCALDENEVLQLSSHQITIYLDQLNQSLALSLLGKINSLCARKAFEKHFAWLILQPSKRKRASTNCRKMCNVIHTETVTKWYQQLLFVAVARAKSRNTHNNRINRLRAENTISYSQDVHRNFKRKFLKRARGKKFY